MEKPNLNRVWRFFIKISLPDEIQSLSHINVMREKVYPLINRLREENIIKWYCFLIKDKKEVPIPKDDDNLYYYIRVELNKGVKGDDLKNALPEYCLPIEVENAKFEKAMKESLGPTITGSIENTYLIDEKVESQWKIIGEISEVIMNMVNVLKADLTLTQFKNCDYQFLHYWFNLTQFPIPLRCSNCKSELRGQCQKCKNEISHVST